MIFAASWCFSLYNVYAHTNKIQKYNTMKHTNVQTDSTQVAVEMTIE